jgi:predicted molibdopterin-dependent oxidoreductase YjgC
MIRAAAEGSIRALVFLRGGPLEQFGEAQAVARALGRLECLIVIDTLPSPVSERAHWVLPSVSFAEREGTYTNSQGRVQRAPKVFSLRGDTREDWRILADLGRALGVWTHVDPGPQQIFQRLALANPAFAGLDYNVIGDLGAPLAAASADVAVG